MKRRLINNFYRFVVLGSTAVVCLFLALVLVEVFGKGAPALSWQFLSQAPTNGMTAGGILPAVIGTFAVTMIATLFAVPFGLACAIYLSEYARPSALTNLIRASIRNLAGVPSIIYGLFGLALFVQALNMGTSVLAAGLTLGLLSLPYIVTTAEEALMQVPREMREAALGLGATQFETVRDVVLPKALPGILTGVVLTLSRAAGETAPILFTGVAFYINGLPTAPNQEFMALPYHLYMLSTQHQAIAQVRPLAYATAVVLIALVFALNFIAFYLRAKKRAHEQYG